MSDKFLNVGGGITNLSNGTANIYVATLASANLEASRPIKTNAVRELVSQNLDIADVINLQSELNTKNELTFTEDDTHTNPPANTVKLYVKTDGQFYKRTPAGVETGFGGGGGISTSNAPVVDNSLVFYDGTTGTLVKSVADMRYDSTNNTLEVTDLETSTTFSLNGELQKISNVASATQSPSIVTVLNGELDVGKLKSITGACEIELNNADIDLLTASGTVSLNANDISISTPTITLNGVNSTLWKKLGSTVGSENFHIGNLSGTALTTAGNNVGIGNNTLQSTTSGVDNICLGSGAGNAIVDSSQNIGIGANACFHKTGVAAFNNIGIGAFSQTGVAGGGTGAYNTSVGAGTLRLLNTGAFNTTMGVNAGYSLTSGGSNTFVGAYCGDGGTTDENCTGIGRNALTNGGTNRTVLGYRAETDIDNSVCIGNSDVVLIKSLGDNLCDLGATANRFKDLYLGGKANVADILVGGTGSIQRPFIVNNPTYSKSFEIERQALGMGLQFMDGSTGVALINSVNNNLGLTATGDIEFSTGLSNKVNLGLKATCNNIEVDGTDQRPFTVLNPTYSKSLEIERQGQGMGIVFMDGATSVGYVNSVNNDMGITATGNVNVSTGLTSTVTGLPLVNSFACGDETSVITTTGLKTTIRMAQDLQVYKIKVSLNAGGGGLTVTLNKNGIQFGSIPVGLNQTVTTPVNSTLLIEDDIITAEVSNITAPNTCTGLKVYLIGRTY